MHFKQERKINKEIGVVICLVLYSEDRVLSNPKVLEDWSVPSVVLMVLMVLVPHFFCLPWAFQPLGVKCGPLAPHISDGGSLARAAFVTLFTYRRVRWHGGVLSCCLSKSPCLNLPKEITINFLKLSKSNPKKDLWPIFRKIQHTPENMLCEADTMYWV